jgi:hypothetical protein
VPRSLRAHLPHRFELSGVVSLLSDVYEQPVERATMAMAHLTYRHAQTRRVEFRSGVGARLFVHDAPRAGVDFFYGIDGYFARRGVVRINLHGGTLGSAGFGEARATIGAMVSRYEIYAGYDHTAIFGREHATLGGPVAGMRAWF